MWNGVERRCTQDLPGAETEAGMVQRTPKRVIDNKPSTEGPAVVSASCADGEEFRAAACQDYILTANLSLNHSSLWNAVDSHSGCEIRQNAARHIVSGRVRAGSH